MERFTKKLGGVKNIVRCGISCVRDAKHGLFFDGEAVDKLAEYEDLEEQGLLARLPCKVGERLFVIWNAKGHWRIVPVDVKEISLGIYMTKKMVQVKVEQISSRGCLFNFYNNDFGEVIFRSREEAEKKVERNGGERKCRKKRLTAQWRFFKQLERMKEQWDCLKNFQKTAVLCSK